MISYHFILQSCYNIIALIPYVYLISLRSIYPITGNMYLLILFIYFDPTFRISQMDVEVYDMWARETSTGRNFDHFEIAF